MNTAAKSYLEQFARRFPYSELVERVNKLSDLKVLVVGDLIIDEYCYCQVSGTVTKSPVIAGIFESVHQMAGGGAVIARHAKELAGKVDYLATVGTRSDKHSFANELLAKEGIGSTFLEWPDSFTVTKTRFISGGYPGTLNRQPDSQQPRRNNIRLFEIGYMPRTAMPADVEEKFCQHLRNILPRYDAVIVADFGHGTVSKRVAETVAANASWWAVNAQTNSSNFGFNRITKYSGANYVCIDELEARLPSGDKVSPFDKVAHELRGTLNCGSLMVTRGSTGLALLHGDSLSQAPALADQVVDTVGAGDAVLAASSLCSCSRVEDDVTAFIGACHGAIASMIVGNEEPVRKAKLLEYIRSAIS